MAITALSSFPGVGVTSFEFPHQDKLIHYLVFGLIATAWLRWLRTRMSVKKAAIAAWSITACFGLTDEIHQAFVPGRTMDVLDWLADALGALTAVLVYTYWPLYRNFLEWPRRS
ncbi:MAG: VanZ family protein [Opitutales bacterium]|nr:VanZ family protein [Opitutales bacterium]